MIGNQRWCQGRDSYRIPSETIRTSDYEVEELADDTTPKNFVLGHHYSGSYPAARFRFGLRRHGHLVGVSVFSHPCSNRVLTSVFPCSAKEAVELGRFVLLDEVPGNGETWFLARCFEALRGRVRGILSFSDPVPRSREDGMIVFPGHIGTIYQAHNARYLGRGKARTLRILPDGRVFSERAISKIRKKERGWQHCVALLESFGAPKLVTEDSALWLKEALLKVTRKLRHPGNHKYAWGLDRHMRRALPDGEQYPKRRSA